MSPLTHEPHTLDGRVWGRDGTFRDSTYVVDEGDLNVTFTLVATSRQTGRSLSVNFTDGNPQSVSLSPNTRTVPPTGGSASYTITVVMGGNNNNCTVTLSVLSSPALPAGATASIPNNVVTTGSTNIVSTLTITTNGVTPGNYSFTVQAARGANCQGNGNLTVGGTLVVFGNATQLAFIQQPTTTVSTQSINPPVTVEVQMRTGCWSAPAQHRSRWPSGPTPAAGR